MEYLPNEITLMVGTRLGAKDLFSWMCSSSFINSLPIWSSLCRPLAIDREKDLLLNFDDNLDWRLILQATRVQKTNQKVYKRPIWQILYYVCYGRQRSKPITTFTLKTMGKDQILLLAKELFAEYRTIHEKTAVLVVLLGLIRLRRCERYSNRLVHPQLALEVLQEILKSFESKSDFDCPIISKDVYTPIVWPIIAAIRTLWIDSFKLCLDMASNLEMLFTVNRRYSVDGFLQALADENLFIPPQDTAMTILQICISTVCDKVPDAPTFVCKCVKALIERGANVNAQTEPSKLTPLHLLIACLVPSDETFAIVKLLVEVGKADLTLTNKDGLTPVHFAEIRRLRSTNMNELKQIIDYLRDKSPHSPPRPKSYCDTCHNLYDVSTNSSDACRIHLKSYYQSHPGDPQEPSQWDCCGEDDQNAAPCYIGYHTEPLLK